MTEENLTLCVPESFRWVDTKIVSSSPNVRAAVTVAKGTDLVFDLGLFRNGEYVHFEALAEVPAKDTSSAGRKSPANRLATSMSFKHRIANTDKVKKMSFAESRFFERMRTRFLIVSWGGTIVFALFLLMTTLYMNRPDITPYADIQYNYVSDAGKPATAKVIPMVDGRLMLKEASSGKQFFMSSDEFSSLKEMRISVVPKTTKIMGFFVVKDKTINDFLDNLLKLFFLLFVSLSIFGTYKVCMRTRRYRVLLSGIESGTKHNQAL